MTERIVPGTALGPAAGSATARTVRPRSNPPSVRTRP